MDLSFLGPNGLPNLTHLTVVEGDNYNIDHIEHFHAGESQEKADEEPSAEDVETKVQSAESAKTQVASPLPAAFQTTEAKRVLEKFVKVGLLTVDYKPGPPPEWSVMYGVGERMSNPEIVIMASLISQTIWKGKNRWKPFQEFWGIQNMGIIYYEAIKQDRTGNIIEIINKILK